MELNTLEYHLCIHAYHLGYLGLVSTKSPCTSDTLKLGNLPLRAYSMTFGDRCFQHTFSKISFNILQYNGIVRLITYRKQSSSLKKWHETIYFIFQSWLLHFLLHSNAKKNLITDEQDKKLKPRNHCFISCFDLNISEGLVTK